MQTLIIYIENPLPTASFSDDVRDLDTFILNTEEENIALKMNTSSGEGMGFHLNKENALYLRNFLNSYLETVA